MGTYTWDVEKCVCSTKYDANDLKEMLTRRDNEGWEFVSVTRINGYHQFIFRKKNI